MQLKAERLRKNKDHSRLLLGTKKEVAPPVDFCSTNISTFKVIGTSSIVVVVIVVATVLV